MIMDEKEIKEMTEYVDYVYSMFEYVKSNKDINPFNEWVYIEAIDICNNFYIDDYSFGMYKIGSNTIIISLFNIINYSMEVCELKENRRSKRDIILSRLISTIIHEVLHSNQQINMFNDSEKYRENSVEDPVRSLAYSYTMKYKNEIEQLFKFNIIESSIVYHHIYMNNKELENRFIPINSKILASNILTYLCNGGSDNKDIPIKILLDFITTNTNIICDIYINNHNIFMEYIKNNEYIYIDKLIEIYNIIIIRYNSFSASRSTNSGSIYYSFMIDADESNMNLNKVCRILPVKFV